MVSKTQKKEIRRREQARQGLQPEPPKERKSVLEKKVRPNMKKKHKIRLGHMSADIYEGFDEKSGVQWTCPDCGRTGRIVGTCLHCSAKETVTKEAPAATQPKPQPGNKAAKKKATKR